MEALSLRPITAAHRGGSGTPMVCLHGFTDSWRSWELVLPALEREHDVLAPTLMGHAGGPPLAADVSYAAVADAVEKQMDEAGFETAHLVGNSLGGYLALELAARGRARTVVALSPAGGWAKDDTGSMEMAFAHFEEMQEALISAAPHAEAIVATPEGRRRATHRWIARCEHIPPGLLAFQIIAAARCEAVTPFIAHARSEGWHVRADRVDCPVRVVWGTADWLLPWPSAAARYREDWLPHADWVELEGAGHCPQLDTPLETAQLILGFTS